jgi:hypothetical protein
VTARQRWLALALIVTLGAAFWPARDDAPDDAEIVAASQPGPKPAPAPAAAEPAPGPTPTPGVAATAPERFATAKAGNLFPKQTWVPPPPPPPKPPPPPPPPPPSPPPLPYTYLGSWAEAGQETLFLAQGDQVIHVRKGDVLAGSWRLDAVTPSQLVFTYLPLDMTRTLRIAP